MPPHHKAAQANKARNATPHTQAPQAAMQPPFPLPLPPRMRPPPPPPPPPPRDREAALARPPEPWRAPHRRAAEAPDRAPSVATCRTRPPDPDPEPRARQGPYRATEERTAREAPVAAMARAPDTEPEPETRPRPGPYRAAREDPVSAMPRPPELEPRPRPGPHHEAEGRAARGDPVATVPRPPEPGPYHAAGGRTTREDPVAAMSRSPEPWPWPYYGSAGRPVRPASSSSALASCLVATVFLLLAGGGAATALFLLFRPRPPDIAVAEVRLPSFAAANGTVAFIFEQIVSVRNPNRAPLAHFDSSLRVAYAGGELGSVYIPAGLIDGGRSKDMSASFAVPAFAAATPPPLEVAAQQPAAMAVMEVDSLVVVKGKVTVLRVLTHRVRASKVCRVGVSPVDGRVLGFRC